MAGLADIPMPDGRRADDAVAVFCRKPARGGMWYNAVSGSAADPEISGFRSGRDGHIKNMAGRGFPVRGRGNDAAAVFCRKPAEGGMWYNAVSGSAVCTENTKKICRLPYGKKKYVCCMQKSV